MPVAVVVPLYNHRAFIGDALRSVLKQTLPVAKIIVVDDGSTDGSAEVVREFDDERIYLFQQENQGAHAAIARGLREVANCDYVSILNSDDIYLPQRIERCWHYLEEHDRCDAVCTNLRLIDEKTALLPASDPKVRRLETVWSLQRADLADWLGYANFAKTSSNFFARSDYLLERPMRPYRYVHDYFFIVMCALESRLAVLDDPLLLYRTHGGNTIKAEGAGSVRRETLTMNLDLLRELAPRLAEAPELRRRCASYFRTLAGNHSDFRLELFLPLLARAVRAAPEDHLAQLIGRMQGGDFPELSQRSSGGLRESAAESALQELRAAAWHCRWLHLGRALGFMRDPFRSGVSAEAQTASARKALEHSRWMALGRRLGWTGGL